MTITVRFTKILFNKLQRRESMHAALWRKMVAVLEEVAC